MKQRHTSLPELLAPAGDLEKLETAVTYGADAVYLGGTAMNLRAGAGGFSMEDLQKGIEFAHERDASVYFCLNALPLPGDLPVVEEQLELLGEMDKGAGVDGLICADPGVMRMARNSLPHLPIHISTQANTSNQQAALFWAEQGASRVNLARELSGDDIRAVRAALDEYGEGAPELEVFIHGAMCMAVSGQCHMSAWMTGRSANMGRCTHPCRFEYKPVEMQVEERLRKGAPCWDLSSEDGWQKILASEDLCLVEFLPELAEAGVAAVKIEGRTKSSAYLAQAVDACRTALDDLAIGNFRPEMYLRELTNAATRPLGTGFYLPERCIVAMPPGSSSDSGEKKSVLGRVLEKVADGVYRVQCKAKWDASRPAVILAPGCRRPEVLPGEYELRDGEGHVHTVLHPGIEAFLHSGSTDLKAGLFLREADTKE